MSEQDRPGISDLTLRNIERRRTERQERLPALTAEISASTPSHIAVRILALERQVERFKKMGYTDTLTGLWNRRYFNQMYRMELAEAAEAIGEDVGLLILDIDNFGKLNKEMGMQAGDKALSSVASIIKGTMRETDEASRLGGEEIAVLMPGYKYEAEKAHSQGDIHPAERIRLGIAERTKERLGREITVSVGFAVHKKGESKEDFFKRVSRATAAAKKAGKNRTVVVEKDETGKLVGTDITHNKRYIINIDQSDEVSLSEMQ